MKRTKALRRELELKTAHLDQLIKLRSKLSEIAIKKSETAMLERMESSNNKFGLLKEQAGEFASKKEVETLQKMVYIALGGFIVVEFLLKYLQ